jgi:hypothetical protein
MLNSLLPQELPYATAADRPTTDSTAINLYIGHAEWLKGWAKIEA